MFKRFRAWSLWEAGSGYDLWSMRSLSLYCVESPLKARTQTEKQTVPFRQPGLVSCWAKFWDKPWQACSGGSALRSSLCSCFRPRLRRQLPLCCHIYPQPSVWRGEGYCRPLTYVSAVKATTQIEDDLSRKPLRKTVRQSRRVSPPRGVSLSLCLRDCKDGLLQECFSPATNREPQLMEATEGHCCWAHL